MVDLDKEKWFPLSDGPKEVGCSRQKLARLIKDGKETASGRVVYLDFALTESGKVTSVEAIARFRKALNDLDERPGV